MVKKRETRSRSTTLYLRPSVYKKLQMVSYVTSKPINTIINELIEQYVVEQQDKVEEYKKMYPEEE